MSRVLMLSIALAGVVAPPAAAQPRLALRPQVGVFAPAQPLVAVGDGYNTSVQLGAAPAIGIDVEYTIAGGIALYGGAVSVFTRLHHSAVMELTDVDGVHSSRATMVAPAAGLMLTPALGRSALRPTLRIGAGAKIYSFDLYHSTSPAIDLTGDFGVGFVMGEGATGFFTEARWMPSRFDARFLPIRTTGRNQQVQSDWVLQIGFRARP